MSVDQTPTIFNEAELQWTNDTVTPVNFYYPRSPSVETMSAFECLQCLFSNPTNFYSAKDKVEQSAQRLLPWLFSLITWHSLLLLTLYLDYQHYTHPIPVALANATASGLLAGSPLIRIALRGAVVLGAFLSTLHLTQSTGMMRILSYGFTIYVSILMHNQVLALSPYFGLYVVAHHVIELFVLCFFAGRYHYANSSELLTVFVAHKLFLILSFSLGFCHLNLHHVVNVDSVAHYGLTLCLGALTMMFVTKQYFVDALRLTSFQLLGVVLLPVGAVTLINWMCYYLLWGSMFTAEDQNLSSARSWSSVIVCSFAIIFLVIVCFGTSVRKRMSFVLPENKKKSYSMSAVYLVFLFYSILQVTLIQYAGFSFSNNIVGDSINT